ncbi:cysteine proteinase [Westerdykella ornata]|uniref:ubiquitinyl hydrolase 1 n=1 Tax=Westerdykella ornata TaxID=318751 RepID=A0A6A6JUY8_WESOR|nr:cysteine proteinase [Westerdykella ornata]KAF2280431.1 cysteine proteinase [Westerdykella ornata]
MSSAPRRRSRRQAGLPPIPTRHPYQVTKDQQTSKISSAWPNARSRRRTRASRGIYLSNNRCYQTTTLQTLVHVPKFMNWLKMHNTSKKTACSPGGVYIQRPMNQGGDAQHFNLCPACAMKDFIAYYWSDQDLDGSGDPQAIRRDNRVLNFLRMADFRFGGNQDSPEVFFDFLKGHIVNSTPFRENNASPWGLMFNALFELQLQKSHSCSNSACPRNTTPDVTEQEAQCGIPGLQILDTGNDNLAASLHRYLAGHPLQDYRCEACNQKNTTTQSHPILAAPDILRICLVPGGYDRFGNPYKITARFGLTEFLDLTRYQLDPSTPLKYRLSSVINHIGELDSGHYIATARAPDNVYVINDNEKLTCDTADPPAANPSALLCRNPQRWNDGSYQAFVLTYLRVPDKELEKLK